MTEPIPVTLISGYLGAGKTTLLNHLLSDAGGRKLCVLVNDFGEIALDEDLIVNRSGDTIALSNGCMCCTIGNDFYAAIDKILRLDPRPEHLVIETSGVADPFKVGQIALAEPDLALRGIIVVVDAINFGPSLSDRFLGDTLRNQLSSAGLIVITKADIAPAGALDDLRADLERLAPNTPRMIAEHGKVPAEMLLAQLALQLKRGGGGDGHHHDHDHGVEYRGWSWSGDARVDVEALNAFLESSCSGLYRLKGIIQGVDGSWREFHRAGDQFECRTISAPEKGGGRAVAVGIAGRFAAESFQDKWSQLLADRQ